MLFAQQAKAANTQLLSNKYKDRFSTTSRVSQFPRLKGSKPTARKRLSGELEKLKKTAKRTSFSLRHTLNCSRKGASFDDDSNNNNNDEQHTHQLPQHDNIPPLCSIPDCEHFFCLPQLPKDYNLTVGHGIEDDHSSIDYTFDNRRKYESIEVECDGDDDDDDDGFDFEVIEPELPEVGNDVFRDFSGAWARTVERASYPLSESEQQQQQSGMSDIEGSGKGDSGHVGYLSGHGPDPDPTQWLDLTLEEWDITEWFGISSDMFGEESEST